MNDYDESESGYLKYVVIGVVVVVVALGALYGVHLYRRNAAIEHGLAAVVAEQNKKLPAYLDSNTRLESVSVEPGRIYDNHCTLLGWSDSQDAAKFTTDERAAILEKLHQSPGIASFAKNGITMRYDFVTEAGKSITQITFTPDDLK